MSHRILAVACLLTLAGCASQSVIVSSSKSITYEHNQEELQDVGALATKHCAKQGKETRLDKSKCQPSGKCVSTFDCVGKD